MFQPDSSILYIEDDEAVRMILCSFMTVRYPGIQTYSAASANEGLELFRKHHPPIILTDMHLNGSDGVQMARSIRGLAPETVIVFITGSPDVERINEFMGQAPCHFISKPLRHEDLFALLDTYIPV